MAAVLACGPGAALSHGSAAAHWGIAPERAVEVSVRAPRCPRPRAIRVHRRARLPADEVTELDRIPLTTPARTLLDLATYLPRSALAAAVNQADRRDLIDPEQVRAAIEGYAGQPGVAALRRLLDRATFKLTDSELERRFLPLARAAGLPPPVTRRRVNGFRVDFYWPDLGLIVETDGLRYHRTPVQQARDRLRDQAHTSAGLTQLRFTHAQVRYEAAHVVGTLERVARRITSRA
jgi:very-short-patch-repair endonuclease